MRVLRLDVPAGTQDAPPVYAPLSITEDRWVACVSGRDLHLHDLHSPDPASPSLRVEHGANRAIAPGVLVCFDAQHGFRRFERRGARWAQVARFGLAGPGGWPSHLALSPSGQRLCVELPSMGEQQPGRVLLLDATNGAMIAAFDYWLGARASFARLGGRELLFLSAPDYMSVKLLDAANGRALGAHVAASSSDFCHTDYDLSPDGERLVVFGCHWGAPYELRLYDARPWTAGAPPAEGEFPLPLLFMQIEELGGESVLATRFTPTSDGLLSVVSLVDPAWLPAPGSEDALDLEAIVSTPGLVEAVRALAPSHSILLRCVDLRSGAVLGWSVAPIPVTRETHVHLLAEHRVILADQVVCLFDGLTGTVQELARFEARGVWFETAVSSDGAVLVVRTVVREAAGGG